MKKLLMLMMLIVAIIFIGSSCEGQKTPIPGPTPTISIPSPTPTIPSPTPTIPSPTPATSGLIPENIRKLAEETTVFIIGRGKPGSGVIIDKQDNTYYILTAAHVVGSEPTPSDPPYKLRIKDKQERIFADETNYHENVQSFRESTDLAIIKFTAEPGEEYQVAPLAKSIFTRMPVYGFGWTSCSGGNQRQFQKTEGEICKINPDPINGWNVSYTNNIIQGMSGGPVFDSSGHVVAIQAGQDRNVSTPDDSCKPLPLQPDPKFNYGLGVPIRENFEMLQSKLPQKLELELQSNISTQKEPTGNIKCRENPPVNQCPPILAPGENCNSRL